MEVLNTTSPTLLPEAPIDVPRNTVPSAKTKMAGLVCDTGILPQTGHKEAGRTAVHPAFGLLSIIAEVECHIKYN
jgi:hypothetical protein